MKRKILLVRLSSLFYSWLCVGYLLIRLYITFFYISVDRKIVHTKNIESIQIDNMRYNPTSKDIISINDPSIEYMEVESEEEDIRGMCSFNNVLIVLC